MKFSGLGGLLAAALALAGIGAGAQGQAGHGAFSPRLTYHDAVLVTGADGRAQSDVFQIGANQVRLYVLHRNVATARGPHDRACVQSVADQSLPRLAMSLVGAAPDARLGPLRWRDGGSPMFQCALVPAADAYRVWWAAEEASGGDWPSWTRPQVFDSFEPMTDQRDAAAYQRNLFRVISSLDLDGMCLAVTLLRPPFSATEGAIGSPLWARPLSLVGLHVSDLPWVVSDDPYQSHRDIPNNEGWYRPRFINAEFGDSADGYVHPIQTAFAPLEALQTILTDHQLGEAIDSITQSEYTYCHGDPILFRGSGPHEIEVFGFLHLLIVIPWWTEYDGSEDAVSRFWEERHQELMLHEMIHVHDFISAFNESIFHAKGNIEFAAHQNSSARLLGADTFFADFGRELINSANLSVSYFHHELYEFDGLGAEVVRRNTDLRPSGPAYIGDEAILSRAQEEFELWRSGQ